jgi:hypothetical protein
MANTWCFETIKSFPHIPRDVLFARCQEALCALGLEITRQDEASGLIEARKRGGWLRKAGNEISVDVKPNGKVTFRERLGTSSPILSGADSTTPMITGKLIAAIKEVP